MNSMMRKKLEVLPSPDVPFYYDICDFKNLFAKEVTRRRILQFNYRNLVKIDEFGSVKIDESVILQVP